jgi:hypothetical protein
MDFWTDLWLGDKLLEKAAVGPLPDSEKQRKVRDY